MAEKLCSAADIREFRTRLGLSPDGPATRLDVWFPAASRCENGRTKLSPLGAQGLMELFRKMGEDGEGLRPLEPGPTEKVQPE